ncbi:MAG: tetratricopeptide repeat protein [Planctomycetaceae bacterium]|nr:tetratricopeptide repeat protein [Planctomycetaceae bacterium]
MTLLSTLTLPSRRRRLIAAAVALVFTCGVIATVWFYRVRYSNRPNVLLITLDTTRADRLGCYGHQAALSPVLDRLAKRGVLFERAYAPAPLTLPSHASILTGLYPPEHGLHNNGQAALPAGLPTLATELKQAGYETGAFVAAFVLAKKFGLSRGFQTYDDDLSRADDGLHGHHRYRAGNLVVDAALAWLKPRSNQPFFCWVHLFDPHYPHLTHEDRFGSQFTDRPYDAEIAYVDAEVGRLISTLEKSRALERTIIVVVGDHGESLGEHGERAHSMTVYDSALRVPLLIAVPGEGRPGHRVPEPVSLVDLCPTLLNQLGLKPLPNISGRSLRTALSGEAMPSQACYAETDEPYQTGHWSPLRALITSQWKYIRSPQAELYDLLDDPHELHNRAMEQPEQMRDLERQLAAWEQRMDQRLADNVALTDPERRTLSSLGYAARRQTLTDDQSLLRDVKDMLPYYDMLNDANAMMDAGRYDLAGPVLRDVLAADDLYFMAHGDLGRCLLRLNQIPEAVVHLRRAMELDPGADRVQAMLGAALFMNGDYTEAIEALEIAIRLNPDLHQSHYNLGLSLEKLGRVDDAIERYQTCLVLLPHFTPARQRLQVLLKE